MAPREYETEVVGMWVAPTTKKSGWTDKKRLDAFRVAPTMTQDDPISVLLPI